MTPAPDDFTRLERLIDRACRAQPPRRAPADLSRHVMAELARRAALPWWHRSFSHWPAGIRAAFVLACLLVVVGSLDLSLWPGAEHAAATLVAPIDQPLSWIHSVAGWAAFTHSSLSYVGAAVMQSIPGRWLIGAIVALCGLYALLCGLGATGYRILYATR